MHPPDTAQTTYRYKARLTFGLQKGREVNVAILLSRFLANAFKFLSDFAFLPYDDDKGQQVCATTQLPDDNSDFYQLYFRSHRVLQHGNFTGMISFQCGLSWTAIKKPSSEFFRWLFTNKVFLTR
jgi:hypothetical protein